MSQTVVERATDNVVESAQQASRATDAIADVIDNSVEPVKHTAKQGCDVAEEFLNETACRLRRHLALTVVATLTTGVVAGVLIGRVLRQRSAGD